MCVDFICVGAQKAGTTAFYELLKQHPDIGLSKKKEVHFFDIDDNYQKGVGWYKEFFDKTEGKNVYGECTPDYLLYNYVPKRIFETLGAQIKLIFILRNPVLRAYSQFNFHKMKGVEFEDDFLEKISGEKLDLENTNYNTWSDPPYYLERGLYFNQISRFLKYFSKEQMLFLTYEDLFGSTKDLLLNETYKFLGVEAKRPENSTKSNQSFVPREGFKGFLLNGLRKHKWILQCLKSLLPKTLYFAIREKIVHRLQKRPDKISIDQVNSILDQYFIDDIKRLERLISKDLSHWYKKS